MEAILEALKEAGRVVVLAVIPILIDSLNAGMVDWKAVFVVGVIALLKFADSWLHESGTSELGLTRF
jgi:hypothetical protein